MVNAGLNGFGRFGLHLVKYWLDRQQRCAFTIAYINDPVLTAQDILLIIKNDPYVRFKDYDISLAGNGLNIKGSRIAQPIHIEVSCSDIREIPWIGKPQLFLECSGLLKDRATAQFLLSGQTKHIIISSAAIYAEMLLFGFNHRMFSPESNIISYGSCTINAYVPLAAWLNMQYGVQESSVYIIHNQPEHKLKDPNNQMMRHKECTLQRFGPILLPFLSWNNFYVQYVLVPYSGSSALAFRFKLNQKPEKKAFVRNFSDATTSGALQNLYEITRYDLGSQCAQNSTHSATFPQVNIQIIGNDLYISGYFDNENSANRYYDLANFIAKTSFCL